MGFTSLQTSLVSQFDPGTGEIPVNGSGIKIVNTGFVSDGMPVDQFSGEDWSIKENIEFSYPVFVPASEGNKVILLLHGLNERSWDKYLAWAYYLAAETGSYVILFPISFHISRAPVSWKDPRTMIRLIRERIPVMGEIRNSSFANHALSRRLADDPRRLVRSGYQTAGDIVRLVSQIRDGSHPVVPATGKINIFSYSIGAFLSEILLMSDPRGLFSDTKLFMFCGGSVFGRMNPESKHIMDKLAFESTSRYYRDTFEEEIGGKGSILGRIVSGPAGMAFRSMLDPVRFRLQREKSLAAIRDRMFVIALSGDRVVPPAGIIETLGDRSHVEVLDFPFDYTHEKPFPIFDNKTAGEVDAGFEKVFIPACRFLE
ncbi:MAG: DUF6051 family protein [Bacteroidales bacterium]